MTDYMGIHRLREKPCRVITGLMSGTSADGVTAAVSRVSGTGADAEIELIGYRTYPYPEKIHARLFNLFANGASSLSEASELNAVIGLEFAEAVNRVVEEAGFSLGEIDLVGSHGQTVWHQPELKDVAGHSYRSTMQIGEPAIIAREVGVPVVADFRQGDVAAGGEGAPLTPYLDYVLHRSDSASRIFQNIGGIANLTYLPA
ncbi:anhydro-N-acetylmuramic acid kinase, partial [Candidatus Bathyarchaeota archaeon]|nr:anhydro-N-acetylmuramic acid kinase [Candidatus Bathyarchaeota archaeon]